MRNNTYVGDIPGIEMADKPDFVEGLPQHLALQWWGSTYSWLLDRSPYGGEKGPNYYGCKEERDNLCEVKSYSTGR